LSRHLFSQFDTQIVFYLPAAPGREAPPYFYSGVFVFILYGNRTTLGCFFFFTLVVALKISPHPPLSPDWKRTDTHTHTRARQNRKKKKLRVFFNFVGFDLFSFPTLLLPAQYQIDAVSNPSQKTGKQKKKIYDDTEMLFVLIEKMYRRVLFAIVFS